MTLFNEYRANNNILTKDGIANYYGKILSSEEANQYFDLLMQNIQWENDDLIFFGKRVTTKRKVAWYGDSEYLYTYSSTTDTVCLVCLCLNENFRFAPKLNEAIVLFFPSGFSSSLCHPIPSFPL